MPPRGETKVILPRQFLAKNLFSEMATSFSSFSDLPAKVVFDFSQLAFIRPSGVVFLSNFTRYLRQRGIQVEYVNMDPGVKPIQFLDDSGFFELHLGSSLNPFAAVRSTTLPLRLISHAECFGWLDAIFLPWICHCTGRSAADFAEIRMCLAEIYNNIKDHSGSEVGSIFAQWYPNEDRLMLAVADFGIGIPAAVRKVEPTENDADAIARAAVDGFSSRTTPRNRGAGLYLMIQNIAARFGGTLTIRSGHGAVRFEKIRESVRSVREGTIGMCPGSLLEISIDTSMIEPVDEEVEEFEWF